MEGIRLRDGGGAGRAETDFAGQRAVQAKQREKEDGEGRFEHGAL